MVKETKTTSEKYGSPVACRVDLDTAWGIATEAKKMGSTVSSFASLLLKKGYEDWTNHDVEIVEVPNNQLKTTVDDSKPAVTPKTHDEACAVILDALLGTYFACPTGVTPQLWKTALRIFSYQLPVSLSVQELGIDLYDESTLTGKKYDELYKFLNR